MSKLFWILLLATLLGVPTAQADLKSEPQPACPPEIGWLPCPPNTEKSDEIKALIAKELYVGAPSSEIEAFFERHRIGYSYNEFGNRYQAIIRNVYSDPHVDQAVSISVFLDQGGRFRGSEVVDTFTAP